MEALHTLGNTTYVEKHLSPLWNGAGVVVVNIVVVAAVQCFRR